MLAFFMAIAKYLQGTWWALDISGSTWVYPFVQATHFSGLSLWIGTHFIAADHGARSRADVLDLAIARLGA